MAEDYEYTALDEDQIRVLQVQPHLDGDGMLQANLRSVSLNTVRNSYVAVSWTWGDEPKAEDQSKMKIKMDGKLFSVRPNLLEMLNTFRELQEFQSFWIDAICINQDKGNPQEKNTQIPMMADIYKAAKEVYVWLGPSADDSDYVMQILRGNEEDSFRDSRFTTAFFKFVQRSWWSRAWIVQEYVLNQKSPKMFCGHAPAVSAELVSDIWINKFSIRQLSSVDAKSMHMPQNMPTIYRLHYLRNDRRTADSIHLARNLRNALLSLRDFYVTEARDKVYATLGMIDADGRKRFVDTVGVHTDKAAGEVFLDATRYLFQCEKSSTIYFDFPPGRHNGLDAPSWVPNLNLDPAVANQSIVRLGNVVSVHLKDPPEDIVISDDRSTLYVRGRILDKVMKKVVFGEETVSGWDSSDQIGRLLRLPHVFHKIQDLVKRNVLRSPYKQLSLEPLWKTLIAGCYGALEIEELEDAVGCQQRFDEIMAIPLGKPVMPSQTFAQDGLFWKLFTLVQYWLGRYNYYLEVSQKTKQKPNILDYIQMVLTTGRTFFAGEHGHYGLSEPGIRNGDVVALLFPDHFHPFILRPRDDKYEMVGVAYIPQVMKEAAIDEIKVDRTLLETFTIV